MPGVWKKTMQYLGLVEDDELEDLEEGLDQRTVRQETSPVRRYSRSTEVDTVEPPPARRATTVWIPCRCARSR